VNYTYTEATFQDDFLLATPRVTSGCDAPPCTQRVRKGNDIPLIPRHRLNAGIDYHAITWLTLSLGTTFVSHQFFRGDEANEEKPLESYVVVRAGLRARWKKFAGYLWINNLLNNKYETFGTFAPNAKRPGDPIEPFLTPALPIHVIAGLSYQF
jgi:outer membrane receptor protein involved in Fe transport